jgi:septal ring factor EnvC (AmiA/AmiB activator)
MSLIKNFRTAVLASVMFISIAFLAGCGGVSDAQYAELNSLREEVKSLEAQASSLKDQKAQLESDIQTINRKLAECNKQKEETKANLEKLPK